MQEWQSLEQVQDRNQVAVKLEVLPFRLALFCTSCSMWAASATSTPVRTADFQALWSSTRLSHVLMLMFASLMARLHVSL